MTPKTRFSYIALHEATNHQCHLQGFGDSSDILRTEAAVAQIQLKALARLVTQSEMQHGGNGVGKVSEFDCVAVGNHLVADLLSRRPTVAGTAKNSKTSTG
jgi:hypothetical protein